MSNIFVSMWFIGDVHGSFQRYKWILHEMVLPPDGREGMDCSLQVGDMGIFTEAHARQLPPSAVHRFIRGNHDNPELCLAHPSYLGDLVYLPRQEMFCICGAYSVDRASRTIGVSWWDDEELSCARLHEAIELYADSRPRVVVSHECPSVVKPFALAANPGGQRHRKASIISRTEAALQRMFELHRPETWIYGHYHQRVDRVEQGTRFIGLGDDSGLREQQVFEIPWLAW